MKISQSLVRFFQLMVLGFVMGMASLALAADPSMA